jgi:hypothetical protein
MKKLLLFVTTLMFVSCSSVKDTTDAALDQVRSGASVGFNTERVQGGYQVSGNASTNVFGVEPYGSFTAGIKYAPRRTVETTTLETVSAK